MIGSQKVAVATQERRTLEIRIDAPASPFDPFEGPRFDDYASVTLYIGSVRKVLTYRDIRALGWSE